MLLYLVVVVVVVGFYQFPLKELHLRNHLFIVQAFVLCAKLKRLCKSIDLAPAATALHLNSCVNGVKSQLDPRELQFEPTKRLFEFSIHCVCLLSGRV